ncbi:MAG TPA: helical backbone metal receptor [Bacteroidia bacterium]|nr:helical backbone metal receptor [Bacteroidia bacterium]
MTVYVDQLNRQVNIKSSPQRIVSLVPSQTELLFDLGVADRVVGVTKFCIHPAEAIATTTIVGGTKQIKHDVIKALQPDLIIANKEENTKEDLELLMQHYPVWISDINNLNEVFSMIANVGEIIGRENEAKKLNSEITKGAAILAEKATSFKTRKRVAYFIWYKPWMVAANDTFIHSMLELCGWQNVFEKQERYPSVEIEQLAKLKPDIILLSSEPFPFKTKHVDMLKTICPQAQVILTDGEMWSWYGSRLTKALPYLCETISRFE